MELISKGIFWKIFKNEDVGFNFFFKVLILMPFSGLAPSKLKMFTKKIKGRISVYRGII